MRILMLLIAFVWAGLPARAQVQKATLQASGLTCSMCSKAVKTALEGVSFVERVQVDIKNQQYNLTFKEGAVPDFDALSAAVDNAGFSVAALRVTVQLPATAILRKDEHLQVGGQTFHVLSAGSPQVNGPLTFSLVDKAFVSAREFKKYSALSKMACVKTGRMASCCTRGTAEARIYHVII